MRLAAFLTSLLLVVTAVVVTLAWPGPGTPWRASSVLTLDLDQFQSANGEVNVGSEELRVVVPAGRGVADATLAMAIPDATTYRYFRFDAGVSPKAVQLLLLWDGDAGSGRAALPATPSGSATLDLARIEGWRGRIDRVRLVAVPVDYLPAKALPAMTLALRGARLENASLSAALGELATQWFALRPWTGRSNNTGGTELAGGVGTSLTAAIALGLGLAWILLRLILGKVAWRTRALGAALLAGAVLAVWQVAQLAARAGVADAAADLARHSPGTILSAQPSLESTVSALARQLDSDRWQPRVLTFGDGRFLSEYPAWLLRQRDVASLAIADQLPAQERLTGTLLVLAGSGEWRFDPHSGQLTVGSQTRRASLYFEAEGLRAFGFDAEPTP